MEPLHVPDDLMENSCGEFAGDAQASDDYCTYGDLLIRHVDDWVILNTVDRLLPRGLNLASDDQARRFISSTQTIGRSIEKLSPDAHALLRWFMAMGPRVSMLQAMRETLVLDPCDWPRPIERNEFMPLIEELESYLLIIRSAQNRRDIFVPMEVMGFYREDMDERRTAAREGYLPPALLLTAAAYHATGNPSPQEIYNGLCQTVTAVGALAERVDYGCDTSLGFPMPNITMLADILALPMSSYEPFHGTKPEGFLAELLARVYEADDKKQIPAGVLATFGVLFDSDPMRSLHSITRECSRIYGRPGSELSTQEIFRAVEDYYKGLFVSLTLSNKLPPHTDYHGGTLRMTGTFMWKKNAVYLGRLFFIGPKLEWHLDKFKVQQWCAWDDPDYTLERVEQMVDHDSEIVDRFEAYRDGPAFNPRYGVFNDDVAEDPWKLCSIDAMYDDPDTDESAILHARLRFNDLISDEAPGLSDVEREELWKCLRDPYREVWIDYRNEEGETSRRRIGRVWLEDESIHAYCHLRGDKRTFRIDRIGAFYSADVPDFDFDCVN